MALFGRKHELYQSLLIQLGRIADSLERGKQNNDAEEQQSLVTQLSDIAQTLEHGNQITIGTEVEKQTLAMRLSDIAQALELGNQITISTAEGKQSLAIQLNNIAAALDRNDRSEVTRAQIEQLNRIAVAIESTLPKEEGFDEADKKTAVYALNLCLVSISQIIDYSDLYVLEQEYEGILNNLNLENIPKDEALLDILRQILDTITFFRIQEDEKKFIEQEYQDEMKTAIWRALPNCNAIFTTPTPEAMLFSLVTQVGTGYMNYRSAKTQAARKRERAMWELHKAATEQFNGLRRELFTTAWRLADRYKFKDQLRLTESQIERYNRALMEPNKSRCLQLLEDMEEVFDAFPPYWYQRGHTALLLSQENGKLIDEEMKAQAKHAFSQYFKIIPEDRKLLRTDPVRAACALEYVSLMEEENRQEKLDYIAKAVESAGTHFDILQLCAAAYLDIGKTTQSMRLLRNLVCEGYNESANAQLLSSIYITEHLKRKTDVNYRKEYDRLRTLTTEDNLLKWPEGITIEEQYKRFVAERGSALRIRFAGFLCDYYFEKTREFLASFNALKEKDEREEMFVRFARALETELGSFADVPNGKWEISHWMREKKKLIEELLEPKKQATSQKFDEIFKDAFVGYAKDITPKLSVLENITESEQRLERAMLGYCTKQVEQNAEPEYTLKNLYNNQDSESEEFTKIKKEVEKRKDKLLKGKDKYICLLIAGSVEYDRYIKDHRLKNRAVVAVINDTTLEDCDLIFTVTGLLVHRGQSVAARRLRNVLASFAGIHPMVSVVVDEAVQYYKDVISYSEVNCTEQKVLNPAYSDKRVDMNELSELISECKKITNGSVVEEIRNAILSPEAGNKSLPTE